MFNLLIGEFFTSLFLGLLAPIGAVCVIPLYPGFIAFLSKALADKPTKWQTASLGLLVMAGVLVFMSIIGLIFTTILEKSLTDVIEVVSVTAFSILIFISILLIANVNVGKLIPQMQSPKFKNPFLTAFLFGFFFGAIILPCNPAPIILLFTKSLASGLSFASFIGFGFGLSLPLIVLSIVSAGLSHKVIRFITKHTRAINVVTGLIMLCVSVYYLVFVFKVFG